MTAKIEGTLTKAEKAYVKSMEKKGNKLKSSTVLCIIKRARCFHWQDGGTTMRIYDDKGRLIK